MAGKQPAQKDKKFYYRRAKWENQGKLTIEKLLVDAHQQLDTVGKRSFSVGSGAEVRGADFKDNGGLYLQIASYVPGEPTSIIDKSKKAKKSDITAQPAPEGKDYLDGEVFVYVKDNHVILCPSGVRENVAQAYILHVLRAVKKKGIAETFELDKVANTNKLRMIRDEGVQEINLKVSLYEASLLHIDKQNPKVSSLKKMIAGQISAIFGKDKDLREIKEKENLDLKISLRYDKAEARKHTKEAKFGELGKKRLEKTAEQVISEFEADHENGFEIVTGQGNRITSDEIRVSDTFRVKTLGKSLSKPEAWAKLKDYHDRLESDGVFEQ